MRMHLKPEATGSGLTSQRVRDRLVERLRANGIAPTLEVRRIMFTKMGKRSYTLFGGAWIEHNLNEAKETVVLDNEFKTG